MPGDDNVEVDSRSMLGIVGHDTARGRHATLGKRRGFPDNECRALILS